MEKLIRLFFKPIRSGSLRPRRLANLVESAAVDNPANRSASLLTAMFGLRRCVHEAEHRGSSRADMHAGS